MVLAGAGPAYAAALVTGLRKPKGQRHGLSDVGDRGRSPHADPRVTRVARRRTPGTTSSAFSPGTAAKRERSLAVASAHARRTDPRARPTRLSRRRDGPARAGPSLDVGGFHHEVPGHQSFGTSSAAPRIRASMLGYARCSAALPWR